MGVYLPLGANTRFGNAAQTRKVSRVYDDLGLVTSDEVAEDSTGVDLRRVDARFVTRPAPCKPICLVPVERPRQPARVAGTKGSPPRFTDRAPHVGALSF